MYLLSCFVVMPTQGVCVDPYELLATSLNSYSVNGCRLSLRNVVDVVRCSNKLRRIKINFVKFKKFSKIRVTGKCYKLIYVNELSLLLDKRIGSHSSELKLIDRLLISVSSAHRLPHRSYASRIF